MRGLTSEKSTNLARKRRGPVFCCVIARVCVRQRQFLPVVLRLAGRRIRPDVRAAESNNKALPVAPVPLSFVMRQLAESETPFHYPTPSAGEGDSFCPLCSVIRQRYRNRSRRWAGARFPRFNCDKCASPIGLRPGNGPPLRRLGRRLIPAKEEEPAHRVKLCVTPRQTASSGVQCALEAFRRRIRFVLDRGMDSRRPASPRCRWPVS